MFICIFHILEFSGISRNYFISRKLPGNDQDFPEFGKFPSKWKQHWIDHLTLACWELSAMNPSQITLEPWLGVMGSNVNVMIIITLSQNLMGGGGAVRFVSQCTVISMGSKLWRLIWSSDYNSRTSRQNAHKEIWTFRQSCFSACLIHHCECNIPYKNSYWLLNQIGWGFGKMQIISYIFKILKHI